MLNLWNAECFRKRSKGQNFLNVCIWRSLKIVIYCLSAKLSFTANTSQLVGKYYIFLFLWLQQRQEWYHLTPEKRKGLLKQLLFSKVSDLWLWFTLNGTYRPDLCCCYPYKMLCCFYQCLGIDIRRTCLWIRWLCGACWSPQYLKVHLHSLAKWLTQEVAVPR